MRLITGYNIIKNKFNTYSFSVDFLLDEEIQTINALSKRFEMQPQDLTQILEGMGAYILEEEHLPIYETLEDIKKALEQFEAFLVYQIFMGKVRMNSTEFYRERYGSQFPLMGAEYLGDYYNEFHELVFKIKYNNEMLEIKRTEFVDFYLNDPNVKKAMKEAEIKYEQEEQSRINNMIMESFASKAGGK